MCALFFSFCNDIKESRNRWERALWGRCVGSNIYVWCVCVCVYIYICMYIYIYIYITVVGFSGLIVDINIGRPGKVQDALCLHKLGFLSYRQ